MRFGRVEIKFETQSSQSLCVTSHVPWMLSRNISHHIQARDRTINNRTKKKKSVISPPTTPYHTSRLVEAWCPACAQPLFGCCGVEEDFDNRSRIKSQVWTVTAADFFFFFFFFFSPPPSRISPPDDSSVLGRRHPIFFLNFGSPFGNIAAAASLERNFLQRRLPRTKRNMLSFSSSGGSGSGIPPPPPSPLFLCGSFAFNLCSLAVCDGVTVCQFVVFVLQATEVSFNVHSTSLG